MSKIKNRIIEIVILLSVIMLLLYSSEPLIYPDSQRYLNMSLHDPPLFSTIINLMLSIFGSFNSIVIVQTISIGLGIIYFTKTLTIQFKLDIYIKIIISIFLFLPIIQFYRHILTEPLSYAFALFFAANVLKLIFKFNYQNLIWVSTFVILLLLIRNQFMFLYPVLVIVFSGIYFIYKSKKTLSWLIFSFLSIVILHNAIINLGKYINQDTFEKDNLSSNYTGLFFFTYIDAIYISSSKDVSLFKNQKIKNTLSLIFKEMDKQEALKIYYDGRGHYGASMKKIRNYSRPLILNIASQENNMVSIKKKISIKLIKENFGEYIKHIFKKFYDSSWLFVFVPFFMLFGSLIGFLKYKSHFSLIIIFISSFTLGNHSIVYLFGRVQPRYFIYTDFILLIFIFIIFAGVLNKKKII